MLMPKQFYGIAFAFLSPIIESSIRYDPTIFDNLRPSGCIHPIYPEQFLGQWCEVTHDRGRQKAAGLLLFHSRDVNIADLPTKRRKAKA